MLRVMMHCLFMTQQARAALEAAMSRSTGSNSTISLPMLSCCHITSLLLAMHSCSQQNLKLNPSLAQDSATCSEAAKEGRPCLRDLFAKLKQVSNERT